MPDLETWTRDDIEALHEVCRGRFVPARAVAAAPRRAPRTIVDNDLRKRVGDGGLELRDPESPNDPDRAYRALDQEPPT